MKIFLTNIPAFYKINLYNELSSYTPIIVLFTGIGGGNRNADFISGIIKFDYVLLHGNLLSKFLQFYCVLKNNKYDELIIGGWENVICLLAPFFSRKILNSCVIESSSYESQSAGLKGLIKRLYLKRIHRVYASGISQARLARNLGFDSDIELTGGCGLLNYVAQPAFIPRKIVENFIYVGRLTDVKNLKLLINVFNEYDKLKLSIIGFGEQEEELKAMAKENVHFVGAVDNKLLPKFYQNSDVFILPSKSEPWGLVVEEALNNGCPVIVSDRVGCREALVNDCNGIVFKYDSENSLRECIDRITNVEYYNILRKNVSLLDFKQRAKRQVDVYLE